jgi:hypothetical protein
MKNPKLILQILNLLNGILLCIFLNKIMGWSTFFNPIKLMHLILAAFILYGAKSYVEVKTNTPDPIKTNKYVYRVFYAGAGVFFIGLALRMLHWPLAHFFIFGGILITFSSYVFSFFAPETKKNYEEDIIDDFTDEPLA